ncbi:MAG: hypothetical protein O7A04_03825 [Acidobacteria bacterium]|nr:hypothetical protein [Acidobacteriota bacterium]
MKPDIELSHSQALAVIREKDRRIEVAKKLITRAWDRGEVRSQLRDAVLNVLYHGVSR